MHCAVVSGKFEVSKLCFQIWAPSVLVDVGMIMLQTFFFCLFLLLCLLIILHDVAHVPTICVFSAILNLKPQLHKFHETAYQECIDNKNAIAIIDRKSLH